MEEYNLYFKAMIHQSIVFVFLLMDKKYFLEVIVILEFGTRKAENKYNYLLHKM